MILTTLQRQRVAVDGALAVVIHANVSNGSGFPFFTAVTICWAPSKVLTDYEDHSGSR
ncbi:hypothetical protein PAXRUDRAFT_821074 [Paxillus rubicundulus Ve08.2h10]|uniref:Uncharacterized protein n=1 Tax=Paxillus rubicundulus Ve08.2h10 TaxID=930991 RepID=A0A0D0E759_9AGAM|nr:hypothetical protein PAXRUDRAFT_821074 [Paxillus rubicundulus Ve08.2h10]